MKQSFGVSILNPEIRRAVYQWFHLPLSHSGEGAFSASIHSFRALENSGSVSPWSFRPLLLHEELGMDGIRYRPSLHSSKGIGQLRVL